MAMKYPFELDFFQRQAVMRLERKECVFVAGTCTELHRTTLYYTVLKWITLYYIALRCRTLNSTTAHYTGLHYTPLRYTIQYHTTLHCTIQQFATLRNTHTLSLSLSHYIPSTVSTISAHISGQDCSS